MVHFRRNSHFERYLIAGICKTRTLQNQEPILIDSDFIRKGYKKYNPPVEFEEKCFHFNKILYLMGGKENKIFELNPVRHFALAYADQEEFVRIIDQLKNDNFITIGKIQQIGRGQENKLFMGSEND